MPDWRSEAGAALARGPVALVSVLATEGSAPRGAGTRMLVTADGSTGTIGGGRLEHQAVAQARAMLAQPPGAWRIQDYPLGPLLGQCCGGRVRLMVERLAEVAWLDALRSGTGVATLLAHDRVIRAGTDAPPTRLSARGDNPERFVENIGEATTPVQLYGAGHVGTAIARAIGGLPFTLAWFDTRPEMDAPGVTVIAEDAIVDCLCDAPRETAVLILTHDHGLDYRLSAAALRRGGGFVGLIGSATKRARFLSRLAAEGVGAADRARLVCPIGLPGIDGKQPEVIAIAVAAQLLQHHSSAVTDAAVDVEPQEPQTCAPQIA